MTTKFCRGVIGETCYNFLNLHEFHLIMDERLFYNPYDIVMFMKHCPLQEKLFINVSILLNNP